MWYQYDSISIGAVVYLIDGLNELIKINDITYVSAPTTENAKIIANFSHLKNDKKKCVIVADSSLYHFQVNKFMDSITAEIDECNFLMLGREGRYANLFKKNLTFEEGWIWGCGIRNDFVIAQNSLGKLLIEGEIKERSQLSEIIQHYYYDGYGSYSFHNSLTRLEIERNECERMIQQLSRQNSDSLNHTWSEKRELIKYYRFLKLLENRNKLYIPYNNAKIIIRILSSEITISNYFDLLNDIQFGVYLARQQKVKSMSTFTYEQLFVERRIGDLNYLHAEFPDLIKDVNAPEPILLFQITKR